MNKSRSISRELALLVLGQISETASECDQTINIENLINKALDTLINHCREDLDGCSQKLESAHEKLLDSELQKNDLISSNKARSLITNSLVDVEIVLNCLSALLELPRLIALSDHETIRINTIERVSFVVQKFNKIDKKLDNVMEGWRLKRLPRIDRDILRLAYIDLFDLKTPSAVVCNEAVELANRYSDPQGRKMINGILRRLLEHSNNSKS
tara:strand:+ start:776 stop:1414 length:639 start_codon:yes stop_codon:yes gene_type:complete